MSLKALFHIHKKANLSPFHTEHRQISKRPSAESFLRKYPPPKRTRMRHTEIRILLFNLKGMYGYNQIARTIAIVRTPDLEPDTTIAKTTAKSNKYKIVFCFFSLTSFKHKNINGNPAHKQLRNQPGYQSYQQLDNVPLKISV